MQARNFGGNVISVSEKKITVRSISNVWELSFFRESPMYEPLKMLFDDGDTQTYLESWAQINYVITNTIGDLDFLYDLVKSYNSFIDRQPKTEEDSDKILEEEKTRYELYEKSKDEANNKRSE